MGEGPQLAWSIATGAFCFRDPAGLRWRTQFVARDGGRGMRSGVAEAAADNGHLGVVGMRARAHSAARTMEMASERVAAR
jgi:hypothetical protein